MAETQSCKVSLSAGIEALSSAMRRLRIESNGELARRLGCPQSMVSRWRRGERKPGRLWAGRIEQLTGVDASLWDKPARAA